MFWNKKLSGKNGVRCIYHDMAFPWEADFLEVITTKFTSETSALNIDAVYDLYAPWILLPHLWLQRYFCWNLKFSVNFCCSLY